MKTLISAVFLTALLSFPGAAYSEPIIGAQTIRDLPLGSTTTQLLIVRAAARYGADAARLTATLNCESEGFQDIQSQIPNKSGPNGQEDSWGVAQINLRAHPDVSIYQALDVRWSVNWAAEQFAAGNEREWSCYNILYPKA